MTVPAEDLSTTVRDGCIPEKTTLRHVPRPTTEGEVQTPDERRNPVSTEPEIEKTSDPTQGTKKSNLPLLEPDGSFLPGRQGPLVNIPRPPCHPDRVPLSFPSAAYQLDFPPLPAHDIRPLPSSLLPVPARPRPRGGKGKRSGFKLLHRSRVF